jgi:hypothetical protein
MMAGLSRSAKMLEDVMKRSIVALGFALAALPLTACVDDGYGRGRIGIGVAYTYDGYYDEYYGPIHDGYWGTNGRFYYRRSERERGYRQGGRDHFRRGGDVHPGGRFRPMQGTTRPPRGARMPYFDSSRRSEHDQGRGPSRDHP